MSRPRPDGTVGADRALGRPRAHGSRGLIVAALVSLALALAVCGRSFGSGLFLYRDFVTVPDPARGPGLLGRAGEAPRAVPLDAVMAGLSVVVGTGVQQQVMLIATLVLAGSGTAVLLRKHGTAAMVAGAAVATWNPYVAERLSLGQPPTLLAYSVTPWLIAVVRSRLGTRRALGVVLLCALPAALTPWGSLVAALVVVGASLVTPRRRRAPWLVGVTSLAVLWCLPWLVPALSRFTGPADPDGAAAFALRTDSPLGLVGSALTLGGTWAAGTVPDSRASTTATAASLVLVVVTVIGLAVVARRGRLPAVLLAGAAWLVPVAAAALAAGPGLELWSRWQQLPGVAIGRDTHRWLGLSAAVSSVLVGIAVGEVARRVRSAPRGARRLDGQLPVAPVAAVVVVVVSAAVLTVPDLPETVASSYRPVVMPSDWAPMVRSAEKTAGTGRVLVLPYQPFRTTAWAGHQPFLDPTPRALRVPVLVSRQLVVVRGQQRWTVDDDVVTGDQLGVGAASAAPDLVELRRHGVTAVVEWLDGPRPTWVRSDGLVRVFDGPHFRVWAVTRSG